MLFTFNDYTLHAKLAKICLGREKRKSMLHLSRKKVKALYFVFGPKSLVARMQVYARIGKSKKINVTDLPS